MSKIVSRNSESFAPVGGLVLIKPLKFKYRTQKQVVPKSIPTEEEVKSDVEIETEVIKQKIKLQQQLAEVLSIGNLDPSKTAFKEGDIVVYDINMVRPFELISGTYVVATHNILGLWL